MSGGSSWAQGRNATLRKALADRFPGVRFSVRNGRRGCVAISWGDGPHTEMVRALVRSIPANESGNPWAATLHREVSPLLMAASYVRDLQAGRKFFWTGGLRGPEQLPPRAWPPPRGLERGCACTFHALDASDVTAQEWVAAGVAVSMAESCGVVLGREDEGDAIDVAEVVYHAADALSGALAGRP